MILDQLLEGAKKYRDISVSFRTYSTCYWSIFGKHSGQKRWIAVPFLQMQRTINQMRRRPLKLFKASKHKSDVFPLIVSWPWQAASWHKRPMLIIYNPIANDEHDRHSNGISLSLVLRMAEMVESGDRKQNYQMLE